MKKAVVLGSSGFIGSHLVDFLKHKGYYVVGADRIDLSTESKHDLQIADLFYEVDLREIESVREVIPEKCDEIYQLAADMGGAGYVFTGENDAEILQNSARINLNVAKVAVEKSIGKLFFSSSACVYPDYNQVDSEHPICKEDSVYPASPDSDYGWEKLSAERLYLAYRRNYNLDVKIARLHNVFGTHCSWNDGKEKAPAAICRKVFNAPNNGVIEIWGNGEQTRSFLPISDCLQAIHLLMNSGFTGPYNIGSEQLISINTLVRKVAVIAKKEIEIKHVSGPIGVNGRVSDNQKIYNDLGWSQSKDLDLGLKELYHWISKQNK